MDDQPVRNVKTMNNVMIDEIVIHDIVMMTADEMMVTMVTMEMNHHVRMVLETEMKLMLIVDEVVHDVICHKHVVFHEIVFQMNVQEVQQHDLVNLTSFDETMNQLRLVKWKILKNRYLKYLENEKFVLNIKMNNFLT